MQRQITLEPVARVKNDRFEIVDGNWDTVVSEIILSDNLPSDCLRGIGTFSHLEILFFFHETRKTVTGSAHPRENPLCPKSGSLHSERRTDPITWGQRSYAC